MKKREKELLRKQLELLAKQSKECENNGHLVMLTSAMCEVVTKLEESRRANRARKECKKKEVHDVEWWNRITSDSCSSLRDNLKITCGGKEINGLDRSSDSSSEQREHNCKDQSNLP